MNTTSTIDSEVTYPLPQPAPLRIAAKIISYVVHPLFIPVYISAYLIYVHPYLFASFDEKQKFLRLLSVFVITVFFPALTVFLLWRLQFASSIYLRTQKERIIPFVSSIIYFFWAFWVARNLEGTPPVMVFFFLGIFLAISAALTANNFFKISLHALAVGGGATFMLLLGLVSAEPMGSYISLSVLIAGLVCTARLIVSDHHPMEIYWGLIISGLSQLVAFYIIM